MLSLRPLEKYGNYLKPVKDILGCNILSGILQNIFHCLNPKEDRIIECVYKLITKNNSRVHVDQCSYFIFCNMNQKIRKHFTLT